MKAAIPSMLKTGPCKAKDCNNPCHYIPFPKGGGVPFQFCLKHCEAVDRGEPVVLEMRSARDAAGCPTAE